MNAVQRDETSDRKALTYRESGRVLGMSERAIWQLVKDGELKAVRIGRAVRIPVNEIDRFLADRLREQN